MKLDLETLNRNARQIRIETLNAVLEMTTRFQIEGKEIDEFARKLKSVLGAELNESARMKIREWELAIVRAAAVI